MGYAVPVAGLKELAAVLRELPNAVARKRLSKPVSDAAALIRNDAARRAPVDTGTLQQAVLMKKDLTPVIVARYIVAVRHGIKAQSTKRWGGIVNLDAYYWSFVEFGTSHSAAQPFMRPAYETNKDKALSTIVDGLRAGVELEAAAMAWSNPA